MSLVLAASVTADSANSHEGRYDNNDDDNNNNEQQQQILICESQTTVPPAAEPENFFHRQQIASENIATLMMRRMWRWDGSIQYSHHLTNQVSQSDELQR